MDKPHPRIERERRTVEAMIRLYCGGKHRSRGDVCDECRELITYTEKRLEKCPYQENKPTCANCPIHCYKADRRQQVKRVMRYSGPRMMFRHPILAIRHWLDGYKKAAPKGHPSKTRKSEG